MTRLCLRGSSLAETILALSLLAVCVLTLFSTLLGGSQLDGLSREQAHALEAASSHMETVLAEDWDSLPAHHNETFEVGLENEVGAKARYLEPSDDRAQPGLIRVLPTDLDDMLEVEVEVKWRSLTQSDAQLTLRTLVAKH